MENSAFSWQSIALLAFVSVITLSIGIGIGICISKTAKKRVTMENYIMILSGIFVVGSIVFQALGFMESFASIVISMFSSVVFSWLLTKFSGKGEWQEREQELALRSYRHIDYIESASKTAEKTIDQYINDNDSSVSPEQKLVLSRALDYIGYIRGGIRTCKMDWYDLMSQEGQSRFTPKEAVGQKVNVDDIRIVNADDISINQEDA